MALPKKNPLEDYDFELDFDLPDFDIITGIAPPEDQTVTPAGYTVPTMERIMRPRLSADTVKQLVRFSNCKEFVQRLDLSDPGRQYCMVSGNFIFADIIEGLIRYKSVRPRKLYITTLSLSNDNIDMLANAFHALDGILERCVIVISAYYYSHEKHPGGLIDYMYGRLDGILPDNGLQIVFANSHMKYISLETRKGNCLTLHGSANLRSSNSVEQFMLEQDKSLYEFNAVVCEELASAFGTINYDIPVGEKPIPLGAKQTWDIINDMGGNTNGIW